MRKAKNAWAFQRPKLPHTQPEFMGLNEFVPWLPGPRTLWTWTSDTKCDSEAPSSVRLHIRKIKNLRVHFHHSTDDEPQSVFELSIQSPSIEMEVEPNVKPDSVFSLLRTDEGNEGQRVTYQIRHSGSEAWSVRRWFFNSNANVSASVTSLPLYVTRGRDGACYRGNAVRRMSRLSSEEWRKSLLELFSVNPNCHKWGPLNCRESSLFLFLQPSFFLASVSVFLVVIGGWSDFCCGGWFQLWGGWFCWHWRG